MQGTFTVRMKRWWKEATDGFALKKNVYFNRLSVLGVFMNDSQIRPEQQLNSKSILNSVCLLHEVCMGRLNSPGSKS